MAQIGDQEKMTAHWIDHYAVRVDSDFAYSTSKYENQCASHTSEQEAELVMISKPLNSHS
jgi:hypothetical protein